MDLHAPSHEIAAKSMPDLVRNRDSTGYDSHEERQKVLRQIDQAIKNHNIAYLSQEQYDKLVEELAERRHIVLRNVPDQDSSSQSSSSSSCNSSSIVN